MTENFGRIAIEKDPALISDEYGVERFKYVNSNTVSYAQREAMFMAYSCVVRSIFGGPLKVLIIGGTKIEFPGDDVKVLNVVGDNDYPTYDGGIIPEENNTFHVVSTCHCLEHVPNIERTIDEIHRVLVPGGFSINIVPDKRYHRHNMSVTVLGETCYREMVPDEFKDLYKNLCQTGRYELVQFNTRDNGLDFDIVLKKIR